MALFSPDLEKIPELQVLMDAAIVAEREKQPSREYLGASRMGEECERRLYYEYTGAIQMPDRKFDGPIYRIFDMGHDGETRMAENLRYTGFNLLTHKPDGGQWGFVTGKHPETGRPRIKGHCDGVFLEGPAFSSTRLGVTTAMTYPRLWETKALGGKSWKSVEKDGVAKSKPVYFSQVQVLAAYLNLPEGALFTALNRDTGEVYEELIPFDPIVAQEASDRGVRVISAREARELPRISNDPSFYKCKWCPYSDECHSAPKAVIGDDKAPGWLFGKK